MWTIDSILDEAVRGRVGERFAGLDGIERLPWDVLTGAAERALARPQLPEPVDEARPLNRRLLAAQWVFVLEHIGLPERPRILEPCAGGSDPVVVALDVLCGDAAEYTTINLNRQLADELEEKTTHLSLPIRIIEDDARNLRRHSAEGSLDGVCFHHAVNDILQTAVAATHDMDTRDVDWWPTERTMIEWLGEQDETDGLTSLGIPELRAIIEAAAEATKPGGFLVFDHWTFAPHLDVDWFPAALFTRMIPLAREVALGLDHGLSDVTPDGLDPQWWLVLRRP